MTEISRIIFKNFFKVTTAIALFLSFIYILSPFFFPVLFGGIIALACSNFLKSFEDRGLNRKFSTCLITALIIIFIIGPATIFIIRASNQLLEVLAEKEKFLVLIQKFESKFYSLLDKMSASFHFDPNLIKNKIDGIFLSLGNNIFKFFGIVLTQIPEFLLLVLITLISLYFFLSHQESIRKLFNHYFYFSVESSNRFICILKSSCREILVSNALTGLMQSLIISLSAWFCDIGDFTLIFIFTFTCSFIPVIGAAPMAFVLAIFAYLDNRAGVSITMIIVGVIAGLSDNILRPYLVSRGETSVPTIVSFLSIIGGVIVMGISGLFIGPLLASLFLGILPIITEEYFANE